MDVCHFETYLAFNRDNINEIKYRKRFNLHITPFEGGREEAIVLQ